MDKVQKILALYPMGKQKSAIMPLLHLAQYQVAEEGPYGSLPKRGRLAPSRGDG
jgi:NADH:ubiquinone oxidoreductase subunit E